MAENAQPWEMQEGETSTQFAAFALYRDMGLARSLRLAARLANEKDGRTGDARGRNRRFEIWSTEWNWVQRAAAWDAELDRIDRLQIIERRKRANRRRVMMGRLLQSKAIEGIREIKAISLTIRELLALVQSGISTEDNGLGVSQLPAQQQQPAAEEGPPAFIETTSDDSDLPAPTPPDAVDHDDEERQDRGPLQLPPGAEERVEE
jgi:hypothetical protein